MNLLEISGLRKGFQTPSGAFHNVVRLSEFAMPYGAQVALQGSSGCGKTTLLHLVAGILRPDEGEIQIDGERLASLSEGKRDRFRARKIGYIFQTFNLLQGCTALENLTLAMMFGKGADKACAAHLLERVGLADRMHYRPRELSVGQQQRVAIARALANRPRLVLADEPTGNLDPETARESLALIRSVCREHNAGLLLVSHDRKMLAQFEDLRDFAALNQAMKEEHSQ